MNSEPEIRSLLKRYAEFVESTSMKHPVDPEKLAKARSRFEAIVAEATQTRRGAGRSTGDFGASVATVWRRILAWRLQVGIGLAALLLAVPVVYMQRAANALPFAEAGGFRGTGTSAIETMVPKTGWMIGIDFKRNSLRLPLTDGAVVTARLSPDSGLNSLNDADQRFFRVLEVKGNTKDGRQVAGSGVLAVREAAPAAAPNAVPHVSRIEWARLTMQLNFVGEQSTDFWHEFQR